MSNDLLSPKAEMIDDLINDIEYCRKHENKSGLNIEFIKKSIEDCFDDEYFDFLYNMSSKIFKVDVNTLKSGVGRIDDQYLEDAKTILEFFELYSDYFDEALGEDGDINDPEFDFDKVYLQVYNEKYSSVKEILDELFLN